MSDNLDRKETYLYGTLLALVQEQLDAIDKRVSGRLGFWGRSRMSARNQTMMKFLRKIITHKISTGAIDPLTSVAIDLECIEQDNAVWDDISREQLEYVRNVLAAFAT